MDGRATQQCNCTSPYVYTVSWLRPASLAFLLARKYNLLTGIMLITCVMWHLRTYKLTSIEWPYCSFPITELYISGESTPIFFSQTVEAKNMADFWRIWRHPTPYLWQLLKVATASQTQFWARYSFYSPLDFFKVSFQFAVIFRFSDEQERFLWFFYTFAIYPKMYELYFISLGSEVKTELIKPWNVGKYDLFCDRKWGPKIWSSMWNGYLNITAWFFHVFHFFTFNLSSNQIFKLYDWIYFTVLH